MIADCSVAAFKSVLSRRYEHGTITFEQPTAEAPGKVPLYEFTWNHTTLQMLKRDGGVTDLQALHPPARLLDSVAEMQSLFAEELILHLEFYASAAGSQQAVCRSCALPLNHACKPSSPNAPRTAYLSPAPLQEVCRFNLDSWMRPGP